MRRRMTMTRAGFVATGLLCVPARAFAAEGMPQLNFQNPLTISQVVWGAVIFLALYLLFVNWGLPRVASVLEERDSRINGDLEAARAAKAQADSAVAELTTATNKARADAQAAINAASEQAKKEAAARSATLQQQLDEQLKAAEQRIAEARSTAMGALRAVATDTATVVVRRLTGREPDGLAIEGAVGAALAARGQR